MNYRETIVYKDLKNLGYEVLLNEERGYPDFRVIDIKNKEMFFVEVKWANIPYKINYKITSYAHNFSGNQKEVIESLIQDGEKVLIAVPSEGILVYVDYSNNNLWREVTYKGEEIKVRKISCKKCSHEWIPRRKITKQCPRCKRYDWDKMNSMRMKNLPNNNSVKILEASE